MIALSIAGFDPSGGAGILADIKTFHSLGVYGTAAITALTSQNVQRVSGINAVDLDFVEDQIDLVLEGYELFHAKTGMLYSPLIVEMVARKIKEYQLQVVVDPVLIAGSGGILSEKGLIDSLKKYLLPKSCLVTPNIYEAEQLSGIKINNVDDAKKAAHEIRKFCPVVITGGHLNGQDVFLDKNLMVIKDELISTDNTHGSGCTYSAAITAFLARGYNLEESIHKANNMVKKSILKGQYGTLNQFFDIN